MSSETDQDTILCPYCAEVIKSAAIKCKHCGSMLQAASAPPQSLSSPEASPAPPGSSPAWVPLPTYAVAPAGPKRTSSNAIAALTLGILAVTCFGPFTGIPAVICANKASAEIRADPTVGGRAMVTWGSVLSWIGMALFVGALISGLREGCRAAF